jgi:hypothetical protein
MITPTSLGPFSSLPNHAVPPILPLFQTLKEIEQGFHIPAQIARSQGKGTFLIVKAPFIRFFFIRCLLLSIHGFLFVGKN